MGLGFFVSTLTLLIVVGVLNGLVTATLWDLINFRNKNSFSSTNLVSSATWSIADFGEAFPPWGGSSIL